MAKCVVCGEKGIFLRVNQEGICFTCESKNSSLLYRNNIQIEETDRNNPLTSFSIMFMPGKSRILEKYSILVKGKAIEHTANTIERTKQRK